MKVFNLSPGEGKTTALVKFMLEQGNEHLIYVAPTRAQAANAHRLAVDIAGANAENVPGRARFISMAQMDPKSGHRYVVDEMDGVLPFAAVAFSDEGKRAAFRAERLAS